MGSYAVKQNKTKSFLPVAFSLPAQSLHVAIFCHLVRSLFSRPSNCIKFSAGMKNNADTFLCAHIYLIATTFTNVITDWTQ